MTVFRLTREVVRNGEETIIYSNGRHGAFGEIAHFVAIALSYRERVRTERTPVSVWSCERPTLFSLPLGGATSPGVSSGAATAVSLAVELARVCYKSAVEYTV